MIIDLTVHRYAVHAGGRVAHMSSLEAAASHVLLTKDRLGVIRCDGREWEYSECLTLAKNGISQFLLGLSIKKKNGPSV